MIQNSTHSRGRLSSSLNIHEDEIDQLNRIVSMWLDYAEDQAKRRKQIFLHSWQEKLDQFLAFNEHDVLEGSGKTTKKEADEKANTRNLPNYVDALKKLKGRTVILRL